jgi:hypothetical protein
MILTTAGLAPCLAPGLMVPLAGCSPAREAGPVIEVQREAAETLARRSVRDAIALRGATEALLDVRRAALIARLETAALEASFAGEPVEIDGWSDARAAQWLERFSAAIDDGPVRRDLVQSLPPVAAFDDDAAALLEALDDRNAQTAALLADLLASTAVVDAAVTGETNGLSPIDLLREVYEQELRDRIDDPDKREAVDRIVSRLLGAPTEGAAQ